MVAQSESAAIFIRQQFITPSVMLLALIILITGLTAKAGDQRGENRQRMEPEGFLYGAGLFVRQEIYQGYDQSELLLPFIGYRGERLRIFGPFVDYSLGRQGSVDFSVKLQPRFAGYDETDSDVFDEVDERKSSLDFGFGTTLQKQNWKLGLSAVADILGRSNGSEIELSVSKVMRYGPVFIEPLVSLNHLDSKLVDYYYGVTASEATSSRPQYEADSAVNASVGVIVATPVFF